MVFLSYICSLMTTLALPHMLNAGRQECEEIASRGMRLSNLRASAIAVNQGMHRKQQQMQKKKEGIFVAILVTSKIGLCSSCGLQ